MWKKRSEIYDYVNLVKNYSMSGCKLLNHSISAN